MAPMIIVNNGVVEFKIPANELANTVSAKQNKYAGKKVPRNPERTMGQMSFLGVSLSAFINKGLKTNPALKILSEATWYGLNPFMPSFIKIKELPQMMHSSTNRLHLIIVFVFILRKGR
jgi:hypothetical protein